MRLTCLALIGAALTLAGCGEAQQSASYSSVDAMAIEAPDDMAVETPAEGASEIPVSAPQIAYTYSLGFRVPRGSIKAVQEQHAEMCEKLGAQKCRIIAMQQDNDGADADYASGRLEIAVAANQARSFARALEATSGEADGDLVSSSLTGEDLSKDIVDTEAHLRSREVLRDRLMDILARRAGTVGELVEAERGVAQVNQEIDKAKSWLATMRGRVAFSQMTITYEAGMRSAVGGFSQPIVQAWTSLGGILGTVIAAIMIALTIALPIAVLIALVRLALHRFGYRLRFWKTDLRGAGGEANPAPD